MSKTNKVIYKKCRLNNRANVYGLCRCMMCHAGKYSFRTHIKRIQKRIRTYWKFDKEVVVGLYTD